MRPKICIKKIVIFQKFKLKNFEYEKLFKEFKKMKIIKNRSFTNFILVNFDKDKYPAFLLLSTLSILLVVENFRIVDLFNNRMNTIFKSYFQVWIIMALFAPVIFSKFLIKLLFLSINFCIRL